MAQQPDITVDSPDQGASLMVRPLTEKGEMVFSSNEWASPHDMSGQDIMELINYFTGQRECVLQMTEGPREVGIILP